MYIVDHKQVDIVKLLFGKNIRIFIMHVGKLQQLVDRMRSGMHAVNTV